jgi:hypothetical protein
VVSRRYTVSRATLHPKATIRGYGPIFTITFDRKISTVFLFWTIGGND